MLTTTQPLYERCIQLNAEELDDLIFNLEVYRISHSKSYDKVEPTITITEYAKVKGISRQAVWSKIKRGIVKATRVGSIWLIQDNH